MAGLDIVKGDTLGNGKVAIICNVNVPPVKIKVKQDELQKTIAEIQANELVKDYKVGEPLKNGMVEVTYTMNPTKPQKYAVAEDKADEFIASYKKTSDKAANMKKPALFGLGTGLLAGFGVSKLLSKASKLIKIPLVALAGIATALVTTAGLIKHNVSKFSKNEQKVLQQYGAERLE